MKKIIFSILALLLITGSSCQKEIELTDEQKATIAKEVKDQSDEFIECIRQLNFDTWSEFLSKDGYISSTGRRGIIYGYTAWADTVRVSFGTRTRHQQQTLDETITVLAPDLALVQRAAIWENWYKNGYYRKANGKATYIWKKEQDGWKIIQLHQSSLLIEEDTLTVE